MISKGQVINLTKCTKYFTELAPEEMSLSGREDTIAWLCKWNHCDRGEKSMLCEYQETLMGDVLNLQVTVLRGGKDDKIQDQVGTIYEGNIMVIS